MTEPFARSVDAVSLRRQHRANFDFLNSELAEAGADRWVRFFNMGYRDLGDTGRAAKVNGDAQRLLSEVLGSHSLAGAVVLEVGCGRGGNLGFIRQHCQPRAAVGVDLVESTLRGAHRANRRLAGTLVAATAEELPLRSESCDAVVNIESSQFYPSITAFLHETQRVLRRGGAFLYADLMLSDLVDPLREVFGLVGLEIRESRDISQNVLASRAAVGARQSQIYSATERRAGLENFIGAQGTASYAVLADGRAEYRIFRALATGRASDVRAIEQSDPGRELRRASNQLLELTGDLTSDSPQPPAP